MRSIPRPRRTRLRSTLAASHRWHPGGMRKFYTPATMRVGAATLVQPLRWAAGPPVELPLSRGRVWCSAFSREDVIAIEPSTGGFDSAAAASNGTCAWLAADAPLHWWVEIDLDS